jgi:nicotinamidase-related amidase
LAPCCAELRLPSGRAGNFLMMRGLQLDEDLAFAPLLVCANLQNDSSPPEQLGPEAPAALARCATLLAHWRSKRWPVAHLRRVAQPSWFDPLRNHGDWIEGFRPHPGELTFEHALPSAFSSVRFAEYIRNVRPSPNLLVGCSLEQTILATAIDGYHRGHQFHVVDDAVLCVPRETSSAAAAHPDIVLQILQFFGERVRSEAIIASHSQPRSRGALAANSKKGGQ